jgi:hypothetical protein
LYTRAKIELQKKCKPDGRAMMPILAAGAWFHYSCCSCQLRRTVKQPLFFSGEKNIMPKSYF